MAADPVVNIWTKLLWKQRKKQKEHGESCFDDFIEAARLRDEVSALQALLRSKS